MQDGDAGQIEKWVIIPVWVAAGGVSRIDWKLPSNVLRCVGIALTISGVQGIITSIKTGELSLSFNDKMSHPVNLDVEQKTSHYRLDILLSPLDEAITPGSRVSGFYMNTTTNQHTANIYLQCIAGVND